MKFEWNDATRRTIVRVGVCVAAAAVLCLMADSAWAAPGGLIKAAARTTLGKVVLGILAVVFAPVLIFISIRTQLHIRKTKKDLAMLAARFPQYRWLDVKDRATASFHWVWSAWTQQKMQLASDYTTSWYWQNQQLQLDEWARRGVENVCHVVNLVNIQPIFVQHNEANDGEGSRLVVTINARVVDYLRESSTGKVVQGDTNEGDLETIWTFVWQGGAWRLNLIEDSAHEWSYLFAPNEVPKSLPAPAMSRQNPAV
jgi:hypothetical protein